MIAKLCYYYGYKPAEVLAFPFPQFFYLLEKLGELVNGDPRRSV